MEHILEHGPQGTLAFKFLKDIKLQSPGDQDRITIVKIKSYTY